MMAGQHFVQTLTQLLLQMPQVWPRIPVLCPALENAERDLASGESVKEKENREKQENG